MRKENSTELPSEAWVVPTALDVTPTNLGVRKGWKSRSATQAGQEMAWVMCSRECKEFSNCVPNAPPTIPEIPPSVIHSFQSGRLFSFSVPFKINSKHPTEGAHLRL